MTPREVIPADVPEEVENEVWQTFKKMVDDLRVYEARIKPSPWRPMETAPKDRPILLYGTWDTERPIEDLKEDPDIFMAEFDECGAWSIIGGDYSCTYVWRPRCWAPLPDPPKDK
jgi:hypothetical protein